MLGARARQRPGRDGRTDRGADGFLDACEEGLVDMLCHDRQLALVDPFAIDALAILADLLGSDEDLPALGEEPRLAAGDPREARDLVADAVSEFDDLISHVALLLPG